MNIYESALSFMELSLSRVFYVGFTYFASVQADGLCYKLTKPCPKMKPVMYDLSRETKDHWEIEKSEIVLKELLGSGNFGEVWKGKRL